MKKLSTMQRSIYERLKTTLERTGSLPEVADLARDLGIHYVSLRQHLQALDKKGYLHFESRGVGKSPRLRLRQGLTAVPVVGAIPAGPLHEAVEDIEGYLPIRAKLGLFGLRVTGDSMADLIQDGDVVLLIKDATPLSGEICAVRVGDADVTLKYFDWSRGSREAILRPHNPRYPVLSVPSEDVVIEGIYRGLLRGAAAEELMQTDVN